MALVLGADKIGISMSTAMMIAFIICAVWWIGVSMPLIKTYHQPQKQQAQKSYVFGEIRKILCEIGADKKILLFLIAYFFYIDGVYTINDMATAYGSA